MTSVIGIDSRLSERLPTRSRLKLGALLQLARGAEDSFRSLIGQAEAVREQIGSINSERSNFIANNKAESLGASTKEPDTSEFDSALEHLQAELARLEAHRPKLESKRYESAQLIARIRSYLEQASLNNVALTRAQLPLAPRLNGEKPPDVVAKIRADLTKAQTELMALLRSPLPTAELKQRNRQYVTELAKAAIPELMVERGGHEVRWPPGCLANGPLAPASLPVFAWLFPDLLTAKLDELIDHNVRGTGASANERPKKEAALRAKIRDLEIQEEALIEQSDVDDWQITRRAAADPMIVLGLKSKNGVA
jgi:hypothetical protein